MSEAEELLKNIEKLKETITTLGRLGIDEKEMHDQTSFMLGDCIKFITDLEKEKKKGHPWFSISTLAAGKAKKFIEEFKKKWAIDVLHT